MAGENPTVKEMEALGESGKGTVYTITKKQAEAVLKKMGHGDKFVTDHPDPQNPTGEQTFLSGEESARLQAQGGLEGKVARIATKYLRHEGSSATILLSADEVKRMKTHGASLKKA